MSPADAAVKPGQFQVFAVSLGPIPSDAKQLALKAVQTHSDGALGAALLALFLTGFALTRSRPSVS